VALGLIACACTTAGPLPLPTVQAGPGADRSTVTLHVGQALVVSLPSTYWALNESSAQNPLSVTSNTLTTGLPRCQGAVPGSGCGVAQIRLVARRTGSAKVTGFRTSCGEALRCTPQQSTFVLTVKVSQ
jgi:hypothetical protein